MIQIVEILFLIVFLVVFLLVFLLLFLIVFLIVFQISFLIISMSSSFSSSPPLTKLLCQRVVFRNILSANNLQRLQKEMLSIHVLSFLFFCLFVLPSACLAVFLFFMFLFQKWYLITKLPDYLRKGDLKLRKTVEIPNCDTNCGNSISSSISTSISSSISTSISSTISNSISNIISSISSSFSCSPPLTKLLCQRVVFRNILSANNLQRLHKEMLSIHVLSFLFFCLFVRPSACLAVFLFFHVASFPRMLPNYETTLLCAKGRSQIAKNCGNTSLRYKLWK